MHSYSAGQKVVVHRQEMRNDIEATCRRSPEREKEEEDLFSHAPAVKYTALGCCRFYSQRSEIHSLTKFIFGAEKYKHQNSVNVQLTFLKKVNILNVKLCGKRKCLYQHISGKVCFDIHVWFYIPMRQKIKKNTLKLLQ